MNNFILRSLFSALIVVSLTSCGDEGQVADRPSDGNHFEVISDGLSMVTYDVSAIVNPEVSYLLVAQVSGEDYKGQGFSGANNTHVTMCRSARADECIAVFHNDEDAFSGVLSIEPHDDFGDWWASSSEPFRDGDEIVLRDGKVRVILRPN